MIYAPHGYQTDGIKFVKATPRCALFVDMGLGKTSISLSAIRDLFPRGEIRRVLVIAPKRVADITWTAEASKWAHTRGLKFSRILGAAGERVEGLEKSAHVFLINRENVKWLVERVGRVWPFDMVIIDESSSFKDSGSERFRAVRKVCRKAARMVLLSGTPAPNSYLELWPQFYLLDQGARLGRTMSAYRDEFFEPDRRGRDRVYTYKLKPGAREQIEARIADITLSLRSADYLELPPRLDNVVTVRLSDAGRRAYDRLERDSVLEVAGDGIVIAANAAALTNKLAQAANGAIYDEGRKVHLLHDEKLDALAEILDTATGPTLVAYAYRHDLARLRDRFPSAVDISEPGAIDQWNAGAAPILLAHPASAGHGLNLQDGGANVVWFGLTWSLELLAQFNARLWRQGQTRPVVISYLCAEGTIDADILDATDSKNDAQEVLLNALRRRVAGIVRKVTA